MVNKFFFYIVLMFCILFFVWVIGWYWVNDVYLILGFDIFMYFLIESGLVFYVLIICVVFMLWLMKLVVKCYFWILVGVICVIFVIGM